MLIDLFDREFVESQEALGMHVLGQFRDRDAADRFVWLRGFSDMEARAHSLAAFYGGPVWAAHRVTANATMIDSDDVLLLRPRRLGAGFVHPPPDRDASARPSGVFAATVYHVSDDDDSFAAFVDAEIVPLLVEAGAAPVATLVTEPSENTFPALPVRAGEHVVVTVARFVSWPDHDAWLERLATSPRWAEVRRQTSEQTVSTPTTIRLKPTARSQLR